jgi:hypothetical protein
LLKLKRILGGAAMTGAGAAACSTGFNACSAGTPFEAVMSERSEAVPVLARKGFVV